MAEINSSFPTIDASLWFYDRTKFAGLTIQNVTQPSMEKISQFGKLRRHAVVMAGTQVELDGRWMFTPSAQARLGFGCSAISRNLRHAPLR